jgi:imidazoleglycerol-phosphate dehydratase
MAARTATVSRKTSETEIDISLNLDSGPGAVDAQTISVSTGIGFLDHVRSAPHTTRSADADTDEKMYTALAKHAGWSLEMKVKGDLWIDDHHTAEVRLMLDALPRAAFNTTYHDFRIAPSRLVPR